VAVAAKLLRVAWACVRHGTVYDAGRVFPASADVAASGGVEVGRVLGEGSGNPPVGPPTRSDPVYKNSSLVRSLLTDALNEGLVGRRPCET
jgi:hypothetical protein